MFKEEKQLDLPKVDQEIGAFWENEKIFQRSINEKPEDNTFVFYEGPPSANGKPGIHHVMARTVKDLFCRFQTMQGKRVERKGGWDTHGLPIELSVEKELGITKEDIGKKITVDEYNQKCRETVMRYKDLWDDITRKMGYWVDLDHPYITFENEYIESVWNLLRKLYDKDYLYKGYTIQPFSPAAGTGLSTHELNQPGAYREVKDTSVTAQFKIVRNEKSDWLYEQVNEGDVYALAWTTTPWTLPSNTALAVGKKIDYVLIRTFNPYTHLPVNVIIAKDLMGQYFKAEGAEMEMDSYEAGQKVIPYKILDSFKGAQLEWIAYEQLLPYVQPEDGDAFKILIGHHVSTEDGTGVVHIAPSFGADDQKIAKEYGFGSLTLVDPQGRFVEAVTDYAGRYVKDYKDEGEDFQNVDIDIAVQLKQDNKAFNVQKYEHNYPHCWRTDKPVLYYPLDSWFIRATKAKERMVELNHTINWKPSHTGEKRFGTWLENLQDWNLSRSRFWGIPLPIWRTEDGSEEKCIGSLAELEAEIQKANQALGLQQSLPKDIHRPYIDEVVLVSEQGQAMKREEDLIDVWFDSGSMPYAQWHYPFENEDKFKANFPADFIAEGVDQTRGWFYTLHAIATMAFDSVAYKNVVSNGLVQDKHGRKMSKRLGNAVEPFETLRTYGADATRWYMITNAQPWDNLKFDLEGIDEVRRKFFGTLHNTYNFFALYANIDGFSFQEDYLSVKERPEIDQWIISLLNTLTQEVHAAYSDYEPTTAGRLIQDFVIDHLSNWYVRQSRRRFWKGDYQQDKIAAYQTLYECLVTVAKLMAPISPFYADWLYRQLNGASKLETHDSIHLSDFPEVQEAVIQKDLEERMDYAQRISSLVLSLRKKENIRVRQPLNKILLPVMNDTFKEQVQKIEDLILQEVNIKTIEYVDDASGVIKKSAKPNFKVLGKRLGKDMKAANAAIAQFTDADIQKIEQEGTFTLELNGTSYELNADDLEIKSEDIPGWQVASDAGLTVALDIQLNEQLLAEGMARELVNRIQNMRKDKDFNVTDRINIQIEQHEAVQDAIKFFGSYIKQEVLGDSIEELKTGGESIELIDGIRIHMNIEKTK
jgi:isoleucyl-tRNA synthetase